MKLSEVRQAIADALGTISGLRVYPYFPDSPQLPCAIVEYPQDWAYDVRFAPGSAEVELAVLVMVSAASDRASQAQLDAFVDYDGTKSLKAAIEADRTLGGNVGACRVTHADSFNRYGDNQQWIGCRIYVKVYG